MSHRVSRAIGILAALAIVLRSWVLWKYQLDVAWLTVYLFVAALLCVLPMLSIHHWIFLVIAAAALSSVFFGFYGIFDLFAPIVDEDAGGLDAGLGLIILYPLCSAGVVFGGLMLYQALRSINIHCHRTRKVSS